MKSGFITCLSLCLVLATQHSLAQRMAAVESTAADIDCLSRQCLMSLVDDYFQALVAHDPTRLPFADEVVFVENADRKPVGEGLWQTATAAPSAFRITIPDPAAMQVGFLGMMEERGEPLMIALRLKILNHRIVEVEHVLARNLRDFMLDNLVTPRPAILAEIPENQRQPRYELLGIALSYYDALVLNNGSLSPFADDCERHENGMITARPVPVVPPEGEPNFGLMGCAGQLDTGVMGYIDDIDNRRVPIADPVTGLAMGFSHFRHAMVNKTIPINGVPGVTEREVDFVPFDLPAAHVFKIRNGQIHEIEAMGFAIPYMSKTGWE